MTATRIVHVGVLALTAALVLSSCGRKPRSPVVARVGDTELTLDDLYASIPAEYRDRITREQNVNYVKQWIDTELLFQEALKRRLQREAVIRGRLEQIKRDLLSAELLTREQIEGGEVRVSDTLVQQYYQQNRETFVRSKEVVKYMQMVVADQPAAQSLMASANAANFAELAERHGGLPEDLRAPPYTPIDELPVEFQSVLGTARLGSVVGPVAMEDGFYVLHVVDRQPAGSTASLEEVRDAITERLTSQLQKREIERFLANLRMRTNVTFNFDAIPGAAGIDPDSAVSE